MSPVTSITVIAQGVNGRPEAILNLTDGELTIHGSVEAARVALDALEVARELKPKESEASR